MRSRSGFPYRGLAQHRPLYRPGFGTRDRDRRRRDRWGRYGYGYPGGPVYWYPFPYVIDPGFYDWGDTGDDAYNDQGGANPYIPDANSGDYGQPYPAGAPGPYNGIPPNPAAPYSQPPEHAPASGGARPAYRDSNSPSAPQEQLTLIFNNGRQPQTMRNYMMNAKILTDMDSNHYERIPLDEIDLAATAQVNRAHGVEFQVPGSESRE